MIKENLKDTGFRWLVNHRTPVRLSSTMGIKHRADSAFRMFSHLASLVSGGKLSASKCPTFHTRDRYATL